jgi:hypothetical protein
MIRRPEDFLRLSSQQLISGERLQEQRGLACMYRSGVGSWAVQDVSRLIGMDTCKNMVLGISIVDGGNPLLHLM